MKRFIAVGAMALVMTTCSSPAVGAGSQVIQAIQETQIQQVRKESPRIGYPVKRVSVVAGPTFKSEAPQVGSVDWMALEKAKQEALEAEIARLEQVAEDTSRMYKVIAKLQTHVGKTWYVFSGATPQGWDCSGLVMWTYEQLGVALEHRASLQKFAGELVDKPKIGDIVAFSYKGQKSAYHVGIWLAPNVMIHAGGKKGERTEIIPIDSFGGDYSTVTFTRIIETN